MIRGRAGDSARGQNRGPGKHLTRLKEIQPGWLTTTTKLMGYPTNLVAGRSKPGTMAAGLKMKCRKRTFYSQNAYFWLFRLRVVCVVL